MDFRGNTFMVQGQGTIYIYMHVYTWRKRFIEKLLRFFEKLRKFETYPIYGM